MPSAVPKDVKRGRLSADELEQIEQMAERGLSAGQISVKLNRNPVTVGYAMHRLGLRKLTYRDFCYSRHGKTVKSFSREEDAYLTDLRIEGVPVARIAEMVSARFGHPRTQHTINVRLVLLSNAEDF